MAQSQPESDTMITGINVTPLVDVVLVLLVILMVTSAFIASQTIPLDLPEGATGESQAKTLTVSVDASGRLFADGELSDGHALRLAVRAARRKSPELRAVIAADGAVSHRHVVRVIDLLRQEGVTRYAISVQPEDVRP